MERMQLMLTLLALCAFAGCAHCDISYKCMKCICQVEGCEREIGKCQMDVGTLSCGPYQIKKPYWIDCGSPGGDWQTCTKQMACSERCVRAYLARWTQRCTGGRAPTCQDYARVHNGGPRGCTNPRTIGYWNRVKACCGGDVCAAENDAEVKPLPSFVVRM